MPKESESGLTPPMFHILLALSTGERHGYAIMQDVAAQSGGKVTVGAGTLYGALKRMLAAGWVTEAEGEVEGNERRRYYRLSYRGEDVLRAEVLRLEALMRQPAIKRVLAREGIR